jgi:hypothetical protein
VSLHVLFDLLEAALMLNDQDAVRQFASALAPAVGLHTTRTSGTPARLLGNSAALLHEPEEARRYYTQALDVAGRIRFRPEVALTRLALAELLFDQYPSEAGEAQEHLDFAIAEFREMKMQPSLERALSHRGLLKA